MSKPNSLKTLWTPAAARPFTRYAWFIVAYTMLVILWGAYVRATGSGAGCGSQWPSCNGTILPRAESTETVIEFSHRLSSGLLGILSLVQVWWATRVFPKRHLARKGSYAALCFVIVEGLLGAALVRFELVAGDTSTARAVVIGLHLINTLLLLGAYTLTAWWAAGGGSLRVRANRNTALTLGIALLGLIIVGAFGAITALGDTLFPAESLAEGFAQNFDPASHFAVRLRVWHPVIAILTSVYIFVVLRTVDEVRTTPLMRQLGQITLALIGVQILLGFINVLLHAPVWMQMVHLLTADLMWVSLLTLTAAALAYTQPQLETDVAYETYSANGHTAKTAVSVPRTDKRPPATRL